MCEAKRYKKIPNPRIDKCIRGFVNKLNSLGIEILACCCGHNRYPMTIIYKNKSNDCLDGNIYDLVSGGGIPRKRNFYKRDKQGYYYVPECV